MHYKYNIGDIVVLRDKLYLGEARVAGYRNSMYVLEFAVDHPELKTIRHPFVGGREFRGLYAAERQIEAVIEHDPVKQIWDDPIAASACEGALPWMEKRFLRKEWLDMAQIQKIDKMTDGIRECAGKKGKERSAEIKAVANMQVGDVMRMDFAGDAKEAGTKRKCVESWRRRNRKNGLEYIICQRKDVLYVERVK